MSVIEVERIERHLGVSYVDGVDVVHVWGEGDARTVRRRWQRLVERELADPAEVVVDDDGRWHAWAPAYYCVPLGLVTQAIESARMSASLRRALGLHASDAWFDRWSTAIHCEIGLAQGWPVLRSMVGREPTTLLGIGTHATMLVRNVPERVGAPLVIAGRDKIAARALLASHGLPVAAGTVVDHADDAVAWAAGRGPVVVKAPIGGNADAVVLGLEDGPGIAAAVRKLLGSGQPQVIVEQQLEGVELRAHVIAGSIARVFLCEAPVVVADGSSALATLIAREAPRVWANAESMAWQRDRLVNHLWHVGVRRAADLERLVPSAGTEIRLGPAVGAQMRSLDVDDALHPDDRDAIEALFQRFGDASGGVDLIVTQTGARLADGGGILEINVPCGWWYLESDIPRLAAVELESWLSPAFRLAGGRVPVWLVLDDDEHADDVAKAFSTLHPAGHVHRLTPAAGWLPALNRKAEAILVMASPASLRAVGAPQNLQPRFVHSPPADDLASVQPELLEIVRRCGGTLHHWDPPE